MINNTIYERLMWLASAGEHNLGPPDPGLRAGCEQALFHEARLLDDRLHRAWLDRFTDDCVYWVPLDTDGDPRRQVSYLLDDKHRMTDRIGLLETGWAHAQNPPSRTTRVVSNTEAWPLDGGQTLARCSVVVWEHRRDRLTPFVSRNDYVFAALGEGWAVRFKIVRLVDRTGDVPKFSFVL